MGGEPWLLIEKISVIPHIKIKIYKIWRTYQQKQSAVYKGQKMNNKACNKWGLGLHQAKPFFPFLCTPLSLFFNPPFTTRKDP